MRARWLSLAAVFMAAAPCSAADHWRRVAAGVELGEQKYRSPQVEMTVLRLDPKVVGIQVIDVVGAADSGPKGTVPDYTLLGVTKLAG